MKRLKWKKAFKAIRKGCATKQIIVEEDNSRGKGSHRGIIFRQKGERRGVLIVIAGGDEISAGVQRRVLKELEWRGEKVPLAKEVLRIVNWVFKNKGR